MLCCAVVVIASTTSSLTKPDGTWISCCVRFFVSFRLSCCMKVEFKLLFPARRHISTKFLSYNNFVMLYFSISNLMSRLTFLI